MSDLEKFKTLEKIKLSYLRHRGNVLEVSAELGLPLDFIKKSIGKIKGQEKRDVSVLIANTLMQHILLGHDSRVHYLMDILRSTADRKQIELSVCCDMPVTTQEGRTICAKCTKEAIVKKIDKTSIYEIIQKTLELLRLEDEYLVNVAEKMGYTNKVEVAQQPTISLKQNFINFGTKEAPQIIDVQKLGGLEAEKVIKELEAIAQGGQDGHSAGTSIEGTLPPMQGTSTEGSGDSK